MNFLDCFSGIGGFRLAFEQAGYKCLGHIEKDKFARQAYEAIFNTKGELINATDITKVSDEEFKSLRGKIDVVLGGFPCQAFSIAGHQRGFEDSRGTLFFDIARAIKQIKPPIFLLENVKGLLSHDKGQTFEVILKTLDELGYDIEWQLLNSADFGVPQNRERVFIIGHLRGTSGRKVFPIKHCSKENSERGAEQVSTITARYGEARGSGTYVIESRKAQKIKLLGGKGQGNRIYDSSGLSVTISSQGGGRGAKTGLYAIPVLTPNRENKRQNGRRCKNDGDDMFTLTAQDIHGVIIQRPRGNNKGGYIKIYLQR